MKSFIEYAFIILDTYSTSHEINIEYSYKIYKYIGVLPNSHTYTHPRSFNTCLSSHKV